MHHFLRTKGSIKRQPHKALLREFVHECGGDKVKWVFYGTPAAGNGVLGCVEAGCCVIAHCEDDGGV